MVEEPERLQPDLLSGSVGSLARFPASLVLLVLLLGHSEGNNHVTYSTVIVENIAKNFVALIQRDR